ncbi:MAG: hypothetical protein KGY65_02135 [Candidatus Thermoplasmatota archaeon]|nr:hypothetical protein [Candidatus Thermoplasmatota archaeon]MBS3801529.1 hypothetical protein [Candidatus Thermoplasmatota archaeon]
MKREHAWRVFAMEYNDAMVSLKGEEKMAPSYVVTPLGSKVNRLFFVGVLTDVEVMSEDGSFVRAHVSDPTGVFTLFSGQYQPEMTEKLQSFDVPSFVAVTGKSRSYQPEDGDAMYASVRPEQIVEVTASLRDQWILETIIHTKDRIDAVKEASSMDTVTADALLNVGFYKPIAEGVSIAFDHYDRLLVEKYVQMLQDAVDYVSMGEQAEATTTKLEGSSSESGAGTEPKMPTTTVDEQDEEAEEIVMNVIKSQEGDDGISWDEITKKCEKEGLDDVRVDETLNSLMDKGLIYEPVLGTIKTT